MLHRNILEVIGNTPIVRLNKVVPPALAQKGVEFYAKLEFMNPGGSIKDRIGFYLIENAEKKGEIKPGGTIVEGTSGNTGMGLAIASAIKGYKCIFVLPDKMSNEKIRNLRAFGARVVVTPTAVEPDDPRSYYCVSKRLAQETPNSAYMNQYNNTANRDCHEAYTGPEIEKQFPNVDAIVMGIGTGGTVCGVGRHFKKKKHPAKIVAVDPIGSIVYEAYKTGVVKTAPKTYKIEGIGEDFLPQNYDFKVIDEMVQVEDRESFVMTRDLLTKEGLFSGISSGSAVVGAFRWVEEQEKAGVKMAGKKVLIILPDSGNRYLSKAFDDDWMREAGFLGQASLGKVSDLVAARGTSPIHFASPSDRVSGVIEIMRTRGISQVPVKDNAGWVKGIVTETALLNGLYRGQIHSNDTIEGLVDSAVEYLRPEDPVEKVSDLLARGRVPLVTESGKGGELLAIITKIDLISFLGASR